jgi:hypothetical protein
VSKLYCQVTGNIAQLTDQLFIHQIMVISAKTSRGLKNTGVAHRHLNRIKELNVNVAERDSTYYSSVLAGLFQTKLRVRIEKH